MPGLGSTGFAIKRQPEIVAEIEDAQKEIFGEELVLDPSSPDAQFNGIISDMIAALWEVGLDLYSGLDPRTASGIMLDRLAAIAGVARQQASASTATVTFTGDIGAVVPAGTIFSAPSIPGVKFTLDEEVILDALGAGTGEVTADTLGALLIAPGVITKIETPISGLDTVTNPNAGSSGTDRETDEELRRRRASSVGIAAVSLIDALYSNVANVTGVDRVKIYENTDTVPDSNGIPAHTLAIFARGGQDLDIASAIALKRSVGCGLYGNVTSSFTDSNGFTHDIKFSRPASVPIYIQVTAVKTASWDIYANARMREAIVDYANGEQQNCDTFLGYDIAQDVYGAQLVYALSSETAVLVQQILVGDTYPAANQYQALDFDEIATFDIANVEIIYV